MNSKVTLESQMEHGANWEILLKIMESSAFSRTRTTVTDFVFQVELNLTDWSSNHIACLKSSFVLGL